MTERRRHYKTEPQDLLLGLPEEQMKQVIKEMSPSDFEVPRTIAESAITAFCQGCDNYQGEGVACPVVGANDQARYAQRKWCGWATIKGERTVKEG